MPNSGFAGAPGLGCWLAAGTASPDGKRIASGGYGRLLRVWDTENGRELFTLPGHRRYINRVAWSPDGSRIASIDGVEARIWDSRAAYDYLRRTDGN